MQNLAEEGLLYQNVFLCVLYFDRVWKALSIFLAKNEVNKSIYAVSQNTMLFKYLSLLG